MARKPTIAEEDAKLPNRERECLVGERTRIINRMNERLYTFAQPDTPVEIVTLRVDALGMFPPPQLPELPSGGDPAAAIARHQPIALAAGRADSPIYDRARLGAGDRIAGPAILTQLDASTLLLPGQTAEVHRFGSLVVHDQ